MKCNDITLFRLVAVERQWVIAVQYGCVLRNDGPPPGGREKHSERQHSREAVRITYEGSQVQREARPAPVTPGSQHGGDEDEQEGRVGDPHDDNHGVHAKDQPGRRQRRRHRLGAARSCAVLAGAGTRAVVQALSADEGLVVHWSENGHRSIYAKRGEKKTTQYRLNKLQWEHCGEREKKLPENIGNIRNGVCPLLMSNMYSIQLVALHSLADLPHSSDRALTLLDGAWTSLQALYMAAKKGQIPSLTEDRRGKREEGIGNRECF